MQVQDRLELSCKVEKGDCYWVGVDLRNLFLFDTPPKFNSDVTPFLILRLEDDNTFPFSVAMANLSGAIAVKLPGTILPYSLIRGRSPKKVTGARV